MASETLLLVLIVREAGLRSSLVARLSLIGADVITAEDFGDRRLARHRERPRMLIVDEAAEQSHDGGATALLADNEWLRLIMLMPGETADDDDPRIIRVSRKTAAKEIAELISELEV